MSRTFLRKLFLVGQTCWNSYYKVKQRTSITCVLYVFEDIKTGEYIF